MSTDDADAVDKILDGFDADYGGDLDEHLGPDWRAILRRRILDSGATFPAEDE